MVEKIKWKRDQLGSTQRAYLGCGFKLVALYPITREIGYVGYVNGLNIGEFQNQQDCMEKCEEAALQFINNLYDKFHK